MRTCSKHVENEFETRSNLVLIRVQNVLKARSKSVQNVLKRSKHILNSFKMGFKRVQEVFLKILLGTRLNALTTCPKCDQNAFESHSKRLQNAFKRCFKQDLFLTRLQRVMKKRFKTRFKTRSKGVKNAFIRRLKRNGFNTCSKRF